MGSFSEKEVERIGKKMLKAIRVSDERLDRVVANDDLFAPIRESISKELPYERNAASLVRTPVSLRRWQVAVPVVCAVLIVIGSFVYLVQEKNSERQVAQTESRPEPSTETFAQPTDRQDDGPQATKAAQRFDNKRSTQKAVVRIRYSVRPTPRHEVEQVGKFQALPYTENISATDPTGQIARVELPRSSLSAMGIDLPGGDQTAAKVKVDLLIGEDGVMRAVRIVDP